MGSDIIDVNAVIMERIRTVEKVDLGSKAGKAVRREVEDATFCDDRRGTRIGLTGRLARLRSWNLTGRPKAGKKLARRGVV